MAWAGAVCDSAHFALRNGPFRSVKRPVLEREMGRFATRCLPVCYAAESEPLVRGGAGYALSGHPVAYAVELLVRGLEQTVGRSLAVYGVYHHLHGPDELHCVEPWLHEAVAGVVYVLAAEGALHEHGLYDDVPTERPHALYYVRHAVPWAHGAVYGVYVCRVYGVELEYVVVHEHERVVYVLAVYEGGVAEHRHLGLREVLVAQCYGVGYDAGEVGVPRGLAVAREGQHVGPLAGSLHLAQLLLQGLRHGGAGGAGERWAVVGVESALAVYAVEGA